MEANMDTSERESFDGAQNDEKKIEEDYVDLGIESKPAEPVLITEDFHNVGLRHRNTSSETKSSNAPESSNTSTSSTSDNTNSSNSKSDSNSSGSGDVIVSGKLNPSFEAFMKGIVEKAPASMVPTVKKVVPYIYMLSEWFTLAIPYFYSCYQKFIEAKDILCSDKYRIDLLVPSFIGLSMCFFGGSFCTVIAAVEAFRMVGYQTTLDCMNDLYEDIAKFLEQNKKDDSIDADNNGKSDVAEMDPKDVITRKTLLFLKTVDPKRVTGALAGINSGFLAVAATLKLQFAKAITLGSSIASMLDKPATKYLLPIIEQSLPEDYKRWGKPIMDYTISSIAISFAWTIQRVVSCFHSASRGGLMFSRNFIEYLNHMKYLKLNTEDTQLDEVVGYFMAFLGISFQLTRGFNLPFPVNLFLLPLTFLEWFLVRIVLNSA